mmetsp:Transcript_167876/g.539219  ORF Transcript_167876/g.539219 Transcript_167876/m.539219 type:complete len:932 (-) Transcript_167876:289-3084(-)
MPAQGDRSPLLLCCEEGLEAGKRMETAKLANTNKRFWNNVWLALAMASWVTFFGLPVYSEYCSWAIFGRKELCGANHMGFKANIGTEKHPNLVNFNSTLVKENYPVYAWCGFLPGSYFDSWPGVVQTMIFTVYQSTGSTVKLAWQGLAGTFCAIFNIYVLTIFFPKGAASDTYREWIGWLDLTIVLFLFLATKADTNTMMYGMSWTVCLMLHFMNPSTGPTIGTYMSPIPYVNWDGETTVTMLTSIAGCVLAIIATVFPRPLLNIRNVHSDAEEIIKGIDKIFTEAINYWAGSSSGPKRHAVYAKMKLLNTAVQRVKQNLADSYWETFDQCNYGKIRKLYGMLYNAIERNSDEVYLLKASTQNLNFDGEGSIHAEIVKQVREPLERLKTSAINCMKMCGAACKDGVITQEERASILMWRKELEMAQKDLSSKFQHVTETNSQLCSEAIAAESLFVFSISNWAQESTDFALEMSSFEETYAALHSEYGFINFWKTAFDQLSSTFDPRAAFSMEQMRYVGVNLMPILLTFALSMYLSGSVFVRYGSTMPSLLTLLVTKDHGIAFIKNAQRLTGVVFGHTMPLLVMSVISMMDCDSHLRFVCHMASIFTFFFMFTFMYYASDQWSSVGCLIAGFGVYPLFVQCDPDATVNYGSHYKDIAQVIIAIMLKICFSNVFSRAEPRDDAVDLLKQLNEIAKKAFAAFFEGKIQGEDGLQGLREAMKNKFSELETLCPKTDPSLAIVPGARTPFKTALLEAALGHYRLILSDLDMLSSAMTGHGLKQNLRASAAEKEAAIQLQIEMAKQEKALFSIMQSQKAWTTVKDDLTGTIDVTFSLLEVVLNHCSEEPLKADEAEKLARMTKVSKLDGLTDFYMQVSEQLAKEHRTDSVLFQAAGEVRLVTQLRRTRLTVVMNALSLALEHSSGISAACFDHMIYE